MRVGQVLQGNVNGIYYLGRKYFFVYWWGKSVLVWKPVIFYFARGLIIYMGVAGR
jgi:hypothetical protein